MNIRFNIIVCIGMFVLFAVCADGLPGQLKLNPPSNSPVNGTDTDSQDAAFLNGEEPVFSVLVHPLSGGNGANFESTTVEEKFEVSSELNQLLTNIVLKHMPHQYEKDKKWGKQSNRWAGIDFRRDHDGGRLETKRRYKMVNHGTWQKYSAELADPENKFSIELSDVARTSQGLTSFDVDFAADLKLDARQSKWVKGVQLYSFSANGEAKVRLSISCELETGLDFGNFPPDLVFTPKITDAKIQVDEFRLHRVSKVGGEIAQQIARRARNELDDKIAEKEQKLVKKLNKEIAENQDDLRLSTVDAIKSNWFGQAKDFLPADVKKALTK